VKEREILFQCAVLCMGAPGLGKRGGLKWVQQKQGDGVAGVLRKDCGDLDWASPPFPSRKPRRPGRRVRCPIVRPATQPRQSSSLDDHISLVATARI